MQLGWDRYDKTILFSLPILFSGVDGGGWAVGLQYDSIHNHYCIKYKANYVCFYFLYFKFIWVVSC